MTTAEARSEQLKTLFNGQQQRLVRTIDNIIQRTAAKARSEQLKMHCTTCTTVRTVCPQNNLKCFNDDCLYQPVELFAIC